MGPRWCPWSGFMLCMVTGSLWGSVWAGLPRPHPLAWDGGFVIDAFMTGTAASALRGFLQASNTAGTDCTVVIVADHSATADAVVQGSSGGYAGGGVVLLRLPTALPGEQPHDDVKRLLSVARKLRLTNGCLTVVFATDSNQLLRTMMEQSTDGRLMVWSTHGVVVTSLQKSLVLSTLEGLWAFTMMNTHLLLLRPAASGDSAVVFRHEPYSPTGRRTRAVGHYHPLLEQNLVATAPMHYDKFKNFYGSDLNFTAACVSATVHANGTKTFALSGAVYQMLLTFGEVLNFKPVYLETESTEQVILEVAKRNSFIVSFLFYVSLNRLEQIDVLAPYITTDNAFVMRRPETGSSWDSFLWPFFMEVWLYILAVVFILPLFILLVLSFSSGDHVVMSKLRGGEQLTGVMRRISPTRVFFEVFGALLGQDFSFRMPHTNSFRILLTAWFIFIIVLSTGYKSNLISFMTSPKVPTRMETLKEIIDSNTTLNIPADYTDLQKMLQAANNNEYHTVASRMTFVKSVTQGLQMAIANGTAHMDERVYLTGVIADQFTKADGSSDLYLAKEKVLNSFISFPIPHDAPYKQRFDMVMLGIVQGGLYRKMASDAIEALRFAKMQLAKSNHDFSTTEAATATSSLKPLTLANLQGPFWLLLGGSSLALLFLVLEMIAGGNAQKQVGQLFHIMMPKK